MPHPLQIEKVLWLAGAYRSEFRALVSAHVSTPVERDGQYVRYALLAISPQHGSMQLGEINPETKIFECYDLDLAFYTTAGNHVVNQVSVPAEQFHRLKTLDEVLGIQGISVTKELIPE